MHLVDLMLFLLRDNTSLYISKGIKQILCLLKNLGQYVGSSRVHNIPEIFSMQNYIYVYSCVHFSEEVFSFH